MRVHQHVYNGVGLGKLSYSDRWIKRLERFGEKAKYPPPPKIPETQIYTQDDIKGLKPINPVWNTRRCGVLAYKLGCMSLWDDWGERHAVTVCQIDRCVVLERRTIATHGYEAVQLGIGYGPVSKQTKNNLGRYIKLNVGAKHIVNEFKCSSDCLLPEGHYMSANHFTPGQWVFVSGFSKPKGFKGAMRRWGFGGQNASHGTESKAHSAPGSISQGKSVHIVWKNTKMGGHVGLEPRVNNCRVFRIETHRNLLFLKGVVPGYVGSVVKIKDALGKTWPRNKGLHIHYPTFIPHPGRPYPVTVQEKPPEKDPFLFDELPMYDKT
ncbi:large subunit ribosomal protein L3 [Babesia microti strain RI]|uniref:Large ribosomal subunit protein uL3m n=1 Tax=Babesia microti (strain RI) TaxID=1133968 RepID=I7J888_BABMR|nr:large subunit ribosomal protein L3 [Babesia microti strain RI]CCF72724.1 large subunit ribosomal protein L3 [Babesia microti strain RI]|eukprot:XP_012647333.1 large subunit ribosomal protein L3 [Babesia microti strain RI]